MIVKREMVSQSTLKEAKSILKSSLNYLRGDLSNIEFSELLRSKHFEEHVKYISRFITFSFLRPLSGIPWEDKNVETFLTSGERQEDYEISFGNHLDLVDEEFNSYIKEHSLDSKMNSEYGSIQIRFGLNMADVEDCSHPWNKDVLSAIDSYLTQYILPYWLNFIQFDKYTVNRDSKPGITVGELSQILIEMGMSFDSNEKTAPFGALFEKEFEFVAIDESEGFVSALDKEWAKGIKVIDALKRDSPLHLFSLINKEEDYRLDFSKGNSLISMALKFGADECLDILLQKGVSLWRTPGGASELLSTEANSTVFTSILPFIRNYNNQKYYSYLRYFMEFMKKEVKASKESGKVISNLEEKIDLLVFLLLLDKKIEVKFLSKFVMDFIYDVLDEDKAYACILSNFYSIDEAKGDFILALKSISKNQLKSLLIKNFYNLYFIYKVTKGRKISPEDIVMDGKNIKQLIEKKYGKTNELVRQINSFWK